MNWKIIVPQTLNKSTTRAVVYLLRLLIHTRHYINIQNIILFLFQLPLYVFNVLCYVTVSLHDVES